MKKTEKTEVKQNHALRLGASLYFIDYEKGISPEKKRICTLFWNAVKVVIREADSKIIQSFSLPPNTSIGEFLKTCPTRETKAKEFAEKYSKAILDVLKLKVRVVPDLHGENYRPSLATDWDLYLEEDPPLHGPWEQMNDDEPPPSSTPLDEEVLYGKVLSFVTKQGHASCFEMMKEFHIPYADACFMMELLEERGIVDDADPEHRGGRPLLNGKKKKKCPPTPVISATPNSTLSKESESSVETVALPVAPSVAASPASTTTRKRIAVRKSAKRR